MDEYKEHWKFLIANKKRRQILFILRGMGSATQAQIQKEFNKRNEFPSWQNLHEHMDKMAKAKLLIKKEYPPMKPEGYYKNKKTGEVKIMKWKKSKYKTFELTAEAKIWLNQLESKSIGVME